MMLDRIRTIFANFALLLGIAHIIFGIVVFKTINLETFWFYGFGLAMILTALANFKRDKIWILRLQNALMLGFISLLVFLTPQPQIWVGCILFAGLFILSWVANNNKVKLTS